jgi:hypothetical protein
MKWDSPSEACSLGLEALSGDSSSQDMDPSCGSASQIPLLAVSCSTTGPTCIKSAASSSSRDTPCLPSTWYAEDSLARMSRAQARALASAVLEAAFGASSPESSANSPRPGSSLKTSRRARRGGSMPFVPNWNDSATKRYRSRLARLLAALPIAAHAFSSLGHEALPTLSACSYGSNRGGGAGRVGPERPSLERLLPTLTIAGNYNRAGLSPTSGDGLATALGGGNLNPRWCEWFMGLPVGWLVVCDEPAFEPSATPSCLSAPKSSARSSTCCVKSET